MQRENPPRSSREEERLELVSDERLVREQRAKRGRSAAATVTHGARDNFARVGAREEERFRFFPLTRLYSREFHAEEKRTTGGAAIPASGSA